MPNPPGMVRPGNIDLDHRPVFFGNDGTYGTERSFSIGTAEGEVLIPQIVGGKLVSQQEAIDHYMATGENMGTFSSVEAADAYATKTHERDQGLGNMPVPMPPPMFSRNGPSRLTGGGAVASRSDYWGAPVDLTPGSIAGGTSSGNEIFGAALDQVSLVDNTNAAYTALERAYGERSRAIKAATGVDLGNPLSVSEETAAGFDPQAVLAGDTLRLMDATVASQMGAYQDKLYELAGTYPQASAAIKATTPIERDAEGLARAADQRLAELLAASPGWSGPVTAFLGGAAGSFRDPLTIGSLAIGGGPGGARTVLGRILATAASEALVNAGTEAIAQPMVQDWRKRAGLPNGFDEASRNVLFAAALGGVFGAGARGLHETVSALRSVRGALPPEARGAIDAADALEAVETQRPADVTPARHEQLVVAADAAVQGKRIDVPEPDEAEINRIVNSLAPSSDSVAARAAARTDADVDRLVTGRSQNPSEGTQRPAKLISDHVRALGGVDPVSAIADELRAVGVTSPGLFRKGGLKNLDNLPHDELPAGVRHTIEADGHGYASQQGMIDGLAREHEGPDGVRMADDERDFLSRQGVDFSRPIEEVRQQVRDVDDALHRWTATSDEVATVPEGLTRREHTAQLVREVLRAQPGLAPDLVRQAVNLSLFERQPIGEAIEDVMSEVAGVPKTVRSAEPPAVPDLRDEPEAPDIEEPELDLAAELEALKELGFTGDLPFGDELVSFAALEEQLEAMSWEAKVVEACKV